MRSIKSGASDAPSPAAVLCAFVHEVSFAIVRHAGRDQTRCGHLASIPSPMTVLGYIWLDFAELRWRNGESSQT
jgi:hypothetical protein